MAAIQSLLNPVEEGENYESNNDSRDEISARDSPTSAASDTVGNGPDKRNRKKQKMCKDAAVFKRGVIQGECRYPPDEYQDELLEAKHQMYEVYPIGDIATYPRHIPYNSEKKLFWEKTGRESFEVFQYQFKIPGESTTYTMLWDYNIGLVRTTPLFKCGNYSKTTPAKMLSRNPGLKELCHSITGGALVAQGYWIPYDAAKAMAATFCWHIRYALTPVFGKDFPNICLPPDSENFGSMQIDAEITKRCALQARHYRELESLVASGPWSGISSPQTPQTPQVRPQLRMILPKPHKETDNTSEYSTDTSHEDKYELSSPSPQIAFTNPWSAVNTPRSPAPISFDNPWSPSSTTRSSSPYGTSRKGRMAANIPRSHTPLDLLPPPRKPLFPTTTPKDIEKDSPAQDMSHRSAAQSMEVDEEYDAGSDDSEDSKGKNGVPARKKSSKGFSDTKAAYVLMKLKTHGGTLKTDAKSLKRRASA
ncbi:uncharacterized protein Z520_04359 [Fonsecaea multimorphosa CBS 102226]|uniref:HTH APSES-type domain-containing protein n=1 Tax=Fonsecaea multimorphosa CBS 102226 TaxID=1442371 RepID=A0A0D2KSL4_9EURO|nr:uncharacterized protein Z520_04359 [Fonsecaea multimorphosa CBS 102226]KIX99723.1 hypothetical protein Z520_04359 [Fonsecaea multimorphosa CBS 102226]OAL26771.1 hypothetical protein AYO22_04124 [Fonsecaea multimorphosa]